MWDGRRYHCLDYELKKRFGEKMYKLSLDGGMTCPNRDGSLGYGGCIFCSGEGSGDFAAPMNTDIRRQLSQAKAILGKKYSGSRYIAYFQSYTNTYAPVSYLEKLFTEVIQQEDIAVLDIATRPDCLGRDVLELIRSLTAVKPVWVELGLQTSDDRTAALIHRCYPTALYSQAVSNLHQAGAEVITHMIIGLPGENRNTILQTADYIAGCGSDGIKLQLLHVLRGTVLAQMYERGECSVLTEDDYISLLCDIIARLPPEIVIHRLTGDGNKDTLIAPLWSCRKGAVLNHIHHALRLRGIIQGCAPLES